MTALLNADMKTWVPSPILSPIVLSHLEAAFPLFFGYHSSDCWHQSTTSLTVLSPGGPLQHVSLWLFVGLANGWRFAFLVLYQALGLEKAGCATRVSNAATGYPLPLLSGLPSLDTFAFGFDVPVAHLSRSGFQRSTMPDTLAGFYYTGQFWGPDSEVS